MFNSRSTDLIFVFLIFFYFLRCAISIETLKVIFEKNQPRFECLAADNDARNITWLTTWTKRCGQFIKITWNTTGQMDYFGIISKAILLWSTVQHRRWKFSRIRKSDYFTRLHCITKNKIHDFVALLLVLIIFRI